MKKTITIFQDYKQNIKEYSDAFNTIESFKKILGDQKVILETDGSIQIKDYTGILEKNGTRLQILPKIHNNLKEDEKTKEASLDYLFRLLFWTGYLKQKTAKTTFKKRKYNLLEIFIQIFINEFLHLFNKSIHYRYINQTENRQFIKGKILFSENIRKNSYRNHLHITEYDEFSIDNGLNQFFKGTIFNLLKISQDGENKKLLKQGLVLLEEVTYYPLSQKLLKTIKFDRQNEHYKYLFNLAKLFFLNYIPGLSEGSDKTYSFLVPMNLLFEEFAGKLIKGFVDQKETLQYTYHSHRNLTTENTSNKFRLEPDFLIKENSKHLAILDSKFKSCLDIDDKISISEQDIYQMISYSFAYDCQNLFLVYPRFLDNKREESLLTKYKLKGTNALINLTIIQIDITKDKYNLIQDELNEAIDKSLMLEPE